MPADQRLRPHDGERVTPIKQLGEEDQTHPSRRIEASGLDALLYIERQLTAQEEVLCLERSTRPDRKRDQTEQVDQELEENMGSGDHVPMMPQPCPRRSIGL